MSVYDHEENAVVNNEGGISETPSDLVDKGEGIELSPNPAGFGFTKQLIVDSLPDSGQLVNTLYLLTVKNNGVIVGYRKYKWNPSDGYVFVGATPDQKLEDGPREQKAIVNTPERRALEKTFNGPVAFNDDVYFRGEWLSKRLETSGFDGNINLIYQSQPSEYVIPNSEIPLQSGIYKLLYNDEYYGFAHIIYSPTGRSWDIVAVLFQEIYKGYVPSSASFHFQPSQKYGGTKIYKHEVTYKVNNVAANNKASFYTTSKTAITTYSQFISILEYLSSGKVTNLGYFADICLKPCVYYGADLYYFLGNDTLFVNANHFNTGSNASQKTVILRSKDTIDTSSGELVKTTIETLTSADFSDFADTVVEL